MTDTIDEVRAAIRAKSDAFSALYAARAFDRQVEHFYLPDAVLSAPGQAMVIGRAAIAEWMRAFSAAIAEVRLEQVKLYLAGEDCAYEISRSILTAVGADAPTAEGRYVATWRKMDGEWFCEVDFFAGEPLDPAVAPGA